MPITDLACVRAQLSEGAFDGSDAHAAALDADLLDRLRHLLLDLKASDLTKIGVTIKREEGEWTWLRDAFTVALEREGREKAAATIRGNDMTKSCSIGVSKSFLIELAKLLDERAQETKLLLDALDNHYGIISNWFGNGCEHGFKPASSCTNSMCEDRLMQEQWDKVRGES